jgi:hypothetical protein
MQNIWKTENTKKINEKITEPWPGPGPALGRQGPPGPWVALSPADVRGIKRPRSLGAWLLSLRWVSAHLASTFVTSCVTKVEVPPTSTII